MWNPPPRRSVVANRMAWWLLGLLGVAAVLPIAVWLVWTAPVQLAGPVPPEPPPGARDAEIGAAATRYSAYRGDITTSRTGIIAGLAGLAALGSLAITTRTYRLSLQSQLTDRYAKAVTQLGDDKLEIRLGGIYALERLAVDSKRDHPIVIEVLSAYIREHTRSRPDSRFQPLKEPTADPPTVAKPREGLPEDLQAAVTVLGRLPERRGVRRADLTGANLSEARMGGLNLSGAIFYRANLWGADFIQANLKRAILARADLTGVHLQEANLYSAFLPGANMRLAHLDEANLTFANLKEADLTEADFTEATLTSARLGGANLRGARGLQREQLREAELNEHTELPEDLGRPNSELK